MPFFHFDTILFHYLDMGKGVPFIFQHGMGGDVHQIRDLFEPPIPFRLLTLDCRGHGETRSVGDPTHLGFASFADDLLAMIDMLHLQQIAVGGISMGAAVALNFALRYPQRVLGLVNPLAEHRLSLFFTALRAGKRSSPMVSNFVITHDIVITLSS